MLKVLMDKGYQVLQLDQRGTGLSTPISGGTLADVGTIEEQAEYVKLFRADNIGMYFRVGNCINYSTRLRSNQGGVNGASRR
jgi:hypothetical protein